MIQDRNRQERYKRESSKDAPSEIEGTVRFKLHPTVSRKATTAGGSIPGHKRFATAWPSKPPQLSHSLLRSAIPTSHRTGFQACYPYPPLTGLISYSISRVLCMAINPCALLRRGGRQTRIETPRARPQIAARRFPAFQPEEALGLGRNKSSIRMPSGETEMSFMVEIFGRCSLTKA